MAQFLDAIYSAENCRLHAYSKGYGKEHRLAEPESVFNVIMHYIVPGEVHRRISFIVDELLKLDPARYERVQQKYVADGLDVGRQSVMKDIKVFLDNGLVRSARGYQTTTKFVRFVIWVQDNHPGFFKEDGLTSQPKRCPKMP